MFDTFELNNDTLLRGYLAHLQAKVRELAALRMERDSHPDAAGNPPKESGSMAAMRTEWEKLDRDLVKVLGAEASLKQFGQLAEPGGFSNCPDLGGRDPFRITFKALKLKADKARRKDDTITLLKSWDLQAKEPKKRHEH